MVKHMVEFLIAKTPEEFELYTIPWKEHVQPLLEDYIREIQSNTAAGKDDEVRAYGNIFLSGGYRMEDLKQRILLPFRMCIDPEIPQVPSNQQIHDFWREYWVLNRGFPGLHLPDYISLGFVMEKRT